MQTNPTTQAQPLPQTIIEPPRATGALAKIIAQINRLEKTEHDLIALLPALPFDEVIEARDSVRLLQCTAWKIEIACDAEIWDRVATNLSKTGVKDADEKGILAAVNKRAKELGCGASTVRANARLFHEFGPVLSSYQGLDDKGFYQAALKADDPQAALESFAERKMENPFFRPADAWREVLNKNDEPSSEHVEEISVLQDPAVREWLEKDIAEQIVKEQSTPTHAPFLRSMMHSRIGQSQWQLSRTVEGDCRIIRQAVAETLGTDDEIFMWLQDRSFFMSDPELDARLEFMVEQGMIRTKQAEGRKKNQRGKMVDIYLPVYGLEDDDD